MTRSEYNDLHESLCYGHDAELIINGIHFFLEWDELRIECYEIIREEGEKTAEFSGSDRFDTVDKLFSSKILGKSLNEDFGEIEVFDIE